jgi:hypothetical protein
MTGPSASRPGDAVSFQAGSRKPSRQARGTGNGCARLSAPSTRVHVGFTGSGDLATRVAAARALKKSGFAPVPVIAARRLRSEAMLREYPDAPRTAGASGSILVVGGDPAQPQGPYPGHGQPDRPPRRPPGDRRWRAMAGADRQGRSAGAARAGWQRDPAFGYAKSQNAARVRSREDALRDGLDCVALARLVIGDLLRQS